MMNITMGMILTICILPTIWMMFFMSYPKDLQSSRLIFGVKNRDEFAAPEIRETVECDAGPVKNTIVNSLMI